MSPRAACRLRALGFERVYDYVEGIADWKAAGFPIEGASIPAPRVADAVRTDVPTCLQDETLAAVKPRVVDGDWDICVVLDCDDLAIGRVRGSDLDANSGRRVADVMEPGSSTVRPDMDLESLVNRMHDRNAPNVIVTTPQGSLLGILLRDEAARLLAGDSPERIWRECECCPGRWADSDGAVADSEEH